MGWFIVKSCKKCNIQTMRESGLCTECEESNDKDCHINME